MKSAISFVERYKNTISNVPSHIRSIINKQGGLSEDHLMELVLNPKDYSVDTPLPPPEDILQTQFDLEECTKIGSEAIQTGSVAYCIMAGDTPLNGGMPKALWRIPGVGMSLLTLKIFQAVGYGPIWIVVSPSTRAIIEDHIRSQMGFDQSRIKFIEQYQTYGLTPDNQISTTEGVVNLYSCGHGDLYPVLTRSGVLHSSIEAGVKYVSVTCVNNIMGYLDPISVGKHITCNANVSCEVIEGNLEDSNSFLCDVNGTYQILKSYKIFGADINQFNWLGTNSYIFNANLNIAPLGREWNRVQKNIDGKVVVQYERLLEEITDAYDTKYFSVNREDRYFTVDNLNDLIDVEKLLNGNKRLI